MVLPLVLTWAWAVAVAGAGAEARADTQAWATRDAAVGGTGLHRGALEPFLQTFPPSTLKRRAARKGQGGGREGGPGAPPRTFPQNDPLAALIVLRYVSSWGKRSFRSLSGPLYGPASEQCSSQQIVFA